MANKLGRLAQGIREIKGTNTIYFIDKSEIPEDKLRQVTYAQIVVDYKLHKAEKNRTRVTVGEDRIHCDYYISAPTCGLPTIKLLWNSILSTPGAISGHSPREARIYANANEVNAGQDY